LEVEPRVFAGFLGEDWTWALRRNKKIGSREFFDFHPNLENFPERYLFIKSMDPCPIFTKNLGSALQRQNSLKSIIPPFKGTLLEHGLVLVASLCGK
jgi:hypothetical protein